MCLIDAIGYHQSAVTLHIYMVGWSVPFRSQNPNKSRVKIQLTRIGHSGPVWPVSEPVWPVTHGCRSFGRHNFLIRRSNRTFYICISIILTRSMQWCSPISNLTKLPRLVWPVYMTGLTSSPELFSEPRYLSILGVNTIPFIALVFLNSFSLNIY